MQRVFDNVNSDGDGAISESNFLAFSRQIHERDDLDVVADEVQEKLQQQPESLHMIKDPYECTWLAADIIGLACDLDAIAHARFGQQ